MRPRYNIYTRCSVLVVLFALFILSITACNMRQAPMDVQFRNIELEPFNPHVHDFTCPPVFTAELDAEAEKAFQEARELESPKIYIDDRNYTKIIALTRRAAERQHWKAMLNLASFYIEGRDPPHGTEDAVLLVEAGMRMGVPAAFDRMGTYYNNGTGVHADVTRAYQFWQRAARMGSPEALTDLGRKLISVNDHPERDRWANEAVGTKMLECAYSQGFGKAAYELGLQYSIPTGREPAMSDLQLAVSVWHNGVRYGCADCAVSMGIEFSSPFTTKPKKINLDKARSERYFMLAEALEFDPERRFPNLDKILPLPPAALPPWDGNSDTLIETARGVSHPSVSGSSSAYSVRSGRLHLDPDFRLELADYVTHDSIAPFSGYWQPSRDDKATQHDDAVSKSYPALYQAGESFLPVNRMHAGDNGRFTSVLSWRLWRTIRHDKGTISRRQYQIEHGS